MNVVEEIKNDMNGLSLIDDWLGDRGVPVAPILANFRAQRCIHGNDGKPCPRNVEPNWWDRVKSMIAETIRLELEIKNRLNMHTDEEESLNMCGACGCCMKLKVWTPIEHIKNHTSKEQLAKMPEHYCWIRKELGQ